MASAENISHKIRYGETNIFYKLTEKGQEAIKNEKDNHIQQICVVIEYYMNNTANLYSILCDFYYSVSDLKRELEQSFNDDYHKTMMEHKEILNNPKKYINMVINLGYIIEIDESEDIIT